MEMETKMKCNRNLTPRKLPYLNNKLQLMTNKYLKEKTLYKDPIQGILDDLADAIIELQERVAELENNKYDGR